MPTSKIEKRLTRQLAAKHEKNPAGFAHALLVSAKIIKPSGELTSKGKVRNAMTPAERARDRAASASGGKHKAGDYRYVSATNTAVLKKGNKMYTTESIELDAKRYSWLRDNGYANEKNVGNAVIGDSKRAQVSFRYWCSPDVLDSLIDSAIAK